MQKMINIFLLLWSYSPLTALTDDSNFSNASLNGKNKHELRFSCFNIYFGEYLIQILTFYIPERQLNLYKIAKLSDHSNFDISQEKAENLKEKLYEHMSSLSEDDLLVEKEALLRQLSDEDNRMATVFNKINMYTTIILGGVPILLTILSDKIALFVQNFCHKSIFESIIFLLLIYFVGNIMIIILQFITIRGYPKSRFSDLKESKNRKETINWQVYYDWQIKKRKADLYVSFLQIIQNWFIIVLLLFFVWLLIS